MFRNFFMYGSKSWRFVNSNVKSSVPAGQYSEFESVLPSPIAPAGIVEHRGYRVYRYRIIKTEVFAFKYRSSSRYFSILQSSYRSAVFRYNVRIPFRRIVLRPVPAQIALIILIINCQIIRLRILIHCNRNSFAGK